MANYELQSDEVVLYEGTVTSIQRKHSNDINFTENNL